MNSQWLPTANRKKMFKRKTKWTFDHVVKDLGYIQLKKKKNRSLKSGGGKSYCNAVMYF